MEYTTNALFGHQRDHRGGKFDSLSGRILFVVFTLTCYLFIILFTSFLANLTFMKEMSFIVFIGLKLIYDVVLS